MSTRRTSVIESAPPHPTPPGQRRVSLDLLRGFALLGTVPVIIETLGLPWSAHLNPTTNGVIAGRDGIVWIVTHVLLAGKFPPLLAALFGAGIAIMAERIDTSSARMAVRPPRYTAFLRFTALDRLMGPHSLAAHGRRMTALLLFALVSSVFLWQGGGMIMLYALSGLLVFPCRAWPAGRLFFASLLCLLAGALLYLGAGAYLANLPADRYQHWQGLYWHLSPAQLANERAHLTGPWLDQIAWRLRHLPSFLLIAGLDLGRITGLLLAGMALLKTGYLTADRPTSRYAMIMVIAVFVGLPLVTTGILETVAHHWDMAFTIALGRQFNYWGSLLIAAGYASFVLVCYKYGWWKGLLKRVRALGRLALSGLLLTMLIGNFAFYGQGLALFGTIDRLELNALAALTALALIGIAPLWLRYFHFGPAEWAVRSLVYQRGLPFAKMHRLFPRAGPRGQTGRSLNR